MYSRLFPRRYHAPVFQILLGAVSLLILLTGCDESIPLGPNGRGCDNIYALLPDDTSMRQDRSALFNDILNTVPNMEDGMHVLDANGSASKQQAQAIEMLTHGGACLLIVNPVDSTAAAAIVTAAKAQQVPVIAYKNLIYSDDLSYYVSDDSMQVGTLQGQYIVAHYQDAPYGYTAFYNRNHIAFLNGSSTDDNATRSANGAHQVLDPLITAGTFKNVYEQFTPNGGDPAIAEQEMATALSAQDNNIQVVLAGNDDLAGGAIQALIAAQQSGHVLVTGAGATVPGLQHILEGVQTMTVYPTSQDLAQATANVAKGLYEGDSVAQIAGSSTIKNPQGSANIPFVIVAPIVVDKSNMASTVLADGTVTTSELCTGLPAGTNTGGICP